MHIGNKVKRNIYLCMTILGCMIIAARIIDPVMDGGFHKLDLVNLLSAIVITLLCFTGYRDYCKKLN